MMIANFTEEALPWKHGGLVGVLEPGDLKEFNDAAGNHILNAMSPRGLLKLTYDEANDIEARPEWEKKARGINHEFWERQIINFNRQNETMRNENKAFIHPPKHIVEASERFGVELMGPWKIKKPEEKKADDAEVKSLKEEVSTLKEAVAELIGGLAQKGKDQERKAALKSLYSKLAPEEFEKFVNENFGAIIDWPDSVREDIRDKWAREFPNEDCPLVN